MAGNSEKASAYPAQLVKCVPGPIDRPELGRAKALLAKREALHVWGRVFPPVQE